MRRLVRGLVAGVIASVVVLRLVAWFHGSSTRAPHLVAEDASAPLRAVAIHYAPSADPVALRVWTQLFAVLPSHVQVHVEVATASDFARFVRLMRTANIPSLDRFHEVVVGTTISTWSRDRYASLDDDGHGSILAPPRIESPSVERAGDARSPGAISRALYARAPRVADIVFEGGDLAATPRYVFADVNLMARNLGRTSADRPSIERELHRQLGQDVIWLGDTVGDVPRHHIMMYMMPLDDTTIAVGDVRAGVALLGDTPLSLDDVDVQAARFDRAAALLSDRGFHVVRVPVLVRPGGGSFVTYTNALFDRHGDTRIVYLPTYALPALDDAARRFYEAQGFEVHPIDVSPIYHLNGSLGCLVNVLARDDAR